MKTYTFVTHAGHLVASQGFTRDDARNRLIAAKPWINLVPDDTRSEAQRLIAEEIRVGKNETNSENGKKTLYDYRLT